MTILQYTKFGLGTKPVKALMCICCTKEPSLYNNTKK